MSGNTVIRSLDRSVIDGEKGGMDMEGIVCPIVCVSYFSEGAGYLFTLSRGVVVLSVTPPVILASLYFIGYKEKKKYTSTSASIYEVIHLQ